jgi:hypothetical protein
VPETVEALFVGGPKDGEILNVELMPTYRVIKTLRPFSIVGNNEDTKFETVEYRLLPFAGEQLKQMVYVVNGMTTDDVIQELIAGYSKSRGK